MNREFHFSKFVSTLPEENTWTFFCETHCSRPRVADQKSGEREQSGDWVKTRSSDNVKR